jgi:hypothetical protein
MEVEGTIWMLFVVVPEYSLGAPLNVCPSEHRGPNRKTQRVRTRLIQQHRSESLAAAARTGQPPHDGLRAFGTSPLPAPGNPTARLLLDLLCST